MKHTRSCHIYQMLKTSAKKRHVSFHTPGHKRGKWDITELSYSDNLSSPHGCIARAEKDIAEILGAAKSYLLTDGSTSGVFSMLHAAKAAGVKRLLVLGAVHKSVYNACATLGITPILTEDYESVDGVLCTSPDYYGNIPDLKELRKICDERGKWLLIDGAHGGHLHFDKTLYAGAYADLWVDGVHKSLPALTQGAVVSANSQRLAEHLRAAVDIFRTTSPSYPIMASVEYAVKYPENKKLETLVRAYAKSEPRVEVRADYTKLCALFGDNAFQAEKYLESKGIYAEFCDGNVICFYLSPATKTRSFARLKTCLKKAFKRYPYIPQKEVQRNPAPLVLGENAQKEWVELTKSEGRICAANCGLFPPCTPLIYAGERIEKDKIRLLEKADNVFGIIDKKIAVLKEKSEE